MPLRWAANPRPGCPNPKLVDERPRINRPKRRKWLLQQRLNTEVGRVVEARLRIPVPLPVAGDGQPTGIRLAKLDRLVGRARCVQLRR